MSRPGGDQLEQIGPLLRRLRRAHGWSQLQLAAELCDASATPRVSRHEVSRWERGGRAPSPFWLGWLAVALEAPLEELEAAVEEVPRRAPRTSARPPGQSWLWRPATAADLLAALDHSSARDLSTLAHAWLAGPPEPADPRPVTPAEQPDLDAGTGRDLLAGWEARLARLRRADDLVGGRDLARRADRRLRGAIQLLRRLGNGALRDRALRLVAGSAQFTGWVQADAGNPMAARRAYRVALRAAALAGDRLLAGHILGSLSCLSQAKANAQEALLLARTALAGTKRCGAPLAHALLLHRAALAAARLGERREAGRSLAEAERTADRSGPDSDPDWLYWLDEAELAAMTGRCLAALGRPLRAVPLLAGRYHGSRRRGAVLYGCWLARCYAELGEREQAHRVVEQVHAAVVATGSARADAGVRHLRPALLRHR